MPVIRVSLPDNSSDDWFGSSLWHIDMVNGHPPKELNVWVPIDGISEQNTLRVGTYEWSHNFFSRFDFDFLKFAQEMETRIDLHDECDQNCPPIVLAEDEFLIFDGRSMHGTQKNRAPLTRVSFDFRVLPLTDYSPSEIEYKSTGPLGLKIVPGEFFDSMRASEL